MEVTMAMVLQGENRPDEMNFESNARIVPHSPARVCGCLTKYLLGARVRIAEQDHLRR
jgi:hypothetical protein